MVLHHSHWQMNSVRLKTRGYWCTLKRSAESVIYVGISKGITQPLIFLQNFFSRHQDAFPLTIVNISLINRKFARINGISSYVRGIVIKVWFNEGEIMGRNNELETIFMCWDDIYVERWVMKVTVLVLSGYRQVINEYMRCLWILYHFPPFVLMS